jgi:hypothetical protein
LASPAPPSTGTSNVCVSLDGLLAAAVVSAAVALGVEWLAKPRLEVCKERIPRSWQAEDEAWRTLDGTC